MPRICLIGAGVIARLHAAAVAKLPQAYELAVTDLNPKALSEFKHSFPHAVAYNDLQAMLSQPAAQDDIVINATPPFGHHQATIEALDSGRHVLCEKPLALNVQQARQMLVAARRKNCLLGCCSTRFLGLRAAGEAKRLLNQGAIGTPYHVTWLHRNHRARSGIEYQPVSRWFLDPQRNGGGVVMDWGPYDIAALCELLDPVRVEVRSAWLATPRTAIDPPDIPMPTEQHAAASMIFHRADGSAVPVTFERSSATHGREQKTHEVEGSHGSLTWDWLGGGKLTRGFDQAGKLVTQTTEHPDDPKLGPHDKPLVFFHRALRGEPSPALINEAAVFNFSCLRAIYDCAANGQPQTVCRES